MEKTQSMTPKNQEVQSLWDQKAEFWDGVMGETGNLFQRRLVNPAAERLLEVQPGHGGSSQQQHGGQHQPTSNKIQCIHVNRIDRVVFAQELPTRE